MPCARSVHPHSRLASLTLYRYVLLAYNGTPVTVAFHDALCVPLAMLIGLL